MINYLSHAENQWNLLHIHSLNVDEFILFLEETKKRRWMDVTWLTMSVSMELNLKLDGIKSSILSLNVGKHNEHCTYESDLWFTCAEKF